MGFIASMWGRHYEQLLNDSFNESSKFTVLDSFGNVLANASHKERSFEDCK